MDENKDTFKVHSVGPVSVVSFQGDGILDEEYLKLVGGELLDVVMMHDKPLVVLDMVNVKFCSSSIIGKFIILYKTVVGLGGKLAFASLNGSIKQVFRITKLDLLFEVHDTVDQAVKSLK